MWNKKFVYVLNYLKTFKAAPENNSLTQSRVDDSCLFQSLYSRKVAETTIALRLPEKVFTVYDGFLKNLK